VRHLSLRGLRLPPAGGSVMGFWHWLVHVTGSDYGLQAGRWSFYGFWSGFGSDIAEVTIIAGLIAVYRKHNCHVSGCWRLARLPVPGTPYVTCRKHNPHGAPTAEKVIADHLEAAISGEPSPPLS
jgi:hypothetical protein